jgi:hypothetical protein
MIGQYPIMTLAKAREGALEALRDIEPCERHGIAITR